MTKPVCETTEIISRRNLKNDYFGMVFGPFSRAQQCRPGHFLHMKLPQAEIFFRRAMSVAGVDSKSGMVEVIFKAVGRGTRQLAKMRKGESLDILGPLGGHFSMPGKNERILLVAGGIGLPPILFYAENLVSRGVDPKRIEFFYGGRNSADLLERSRIKKLSVNFHPTTDDGSFGQKGLVTKQVDLLIRSAGKEKLRLYACGPEPMLKAVDQIGLEHGVPGQLSLEAPMPCGIGVCLGCIVPLVKGGYARVCADGPVFEIGEVVL